MTSTAPKTKSRAFALLAMTLLSVALTSCVSDSNAPKAMPLSIYQPRSLQLKAGVTISTKGGNYTPQTDETWHSAAAFNEVEQENINLSSALAQKQDNPR